MPEKKAKPPPGTDDWIETPGARRSSTAPVLEKVGTTSVFEVAPTLTALEIHAGDEIAFTMALLPDAITVAIPTERSKSIAGLCGSPSHVPVVNGLPPRLRLTEEISKLPRRP